MASYDMRRIQVTRREFEVPCYGEGKWDGAASAEVAKAMHAARTELESAGVSIGDNTIMVRPGDASIIVYYVTDEGMSDVPVVAARNDALVLRNQLRNTERELVDLIGDPGAGLSATTLARLERQLGDVQRVLRKSEEV
jgi:Asp-tRNA(Asn)/Glu-tRNA(Gln) amidotransferase A subunit family amidase